MSQSILLIEDQAAAAKLVLGYLGSLGFAAAHFGTGEEGLAALRRGKFDLVLLDLGLPDMGGEEVLERIRSSRPWIPVVMTTGETEVEAALRCLRLGARDYLTKPFSLPQLGGAIERELRQSGLTRRLRALRSQDGPKGLARLQGGSPGIVRARTLLEKAAAVDIGVLLCGETGTGKDLAAQALHESSRRAPGPFVAMDCGALPEKLLESELFGYEKGAFTGADTAKKGRLELAHGGTLFLDEVGELSLGSQAKLLRVLQERKLRRMGGRSDLAIDVRVVAATHVDLAAARRDRRFREDLYHRLAEFNVELPPLRERVGDIRPLATSLLQSTALAFEKPVDGIEEPAMKALEAYRWPGNVRELVHALRQSLLRCSQTLTLADLPERVSGLEPDRSGPQGPLAPLVEAALARAEGVMIQRALEACRWNRQETARLLGIDPKTLLVRMKRHGHDD